MISVFGCADRIPFNQYEVRVVLPQPAIPEITNIGTSDENHASNFSISIDLPCTALVAGGRLW